MIYWGRLQRSDKEAGNAEGETEQLSSVLPRRKARVAAENF